MPRPVNFESFVRDFVDYVYLISAKDITPSDLLAIFSPVMQEIRLWSKDDKIVGKLDNTDSELYAYLVAVYQGDNERVLNLLRSSSSPYIKLMYIALAFDQNKGEFNTDTLLINHTKGVNDNTIDYRVAEILFCESFSPCSDPDVMTNAHRVYRIENAITLVDAIRLRKLSEGDNITSLPLHMIFTHPNQNDASFRYGLQLLDSGVLPMDIIGQATLPKNNYYKLLNHCVEVAAERNQLDLEGYWKHIECTGGILWGDLLLFVPAAVFIRNQDGDRIRAATLGYMPAIAHCVANNLQYTTSIERRLRDLHELWLQNYLTNDQFFVAIMAMEPKIDRASFALRAFLLSELCVANGWTFLVEVFYAYIRSSGTVGLLTTSELIMIITNCQHYKRASLAESLLPHLISRALTDQEKLIAGMLKDKDCSSYAFHDAPLTLECFSLANKFKAMPVRLDELCEIMKPFMRLASDKAKTLSCWLENNYGCYVVEWFVTLYLMTGNQINKDEIFNTVLKNTLLQYDPNNITAKQFEEIHVRIASYMPGNFKFQEAYHDTRYNIEHRDEIKFEENEHQQLLHLCRDLIADLDAYQAPVNQDIVSGLGMLSLTARNNASLTDFRKSVRELQSKLVNDGMQVNDGKQSLIKLVNDYILKNKDNSAYQLAQIKQFFDLAKDEQLTIEHFERFLQQYRIESIEEAPVSTEEQPLLAVDAASACAKPTR